LRNEASRTLIKRFSETSGKEISGILEELAELAAEPLDAENIPREDQTTFFQVDLRYHGQGLLLTVDLDVANLRKNGLDEIGVPFDEIHTQIFTFALDAEKEIVNLRAIVQGKAALVNAEKISRGADDPSAAVIAQQTVYIEGAEQTANIYDRNRLLAGNHIHGPAIITEMDSTSLILPDHTAVIDDFGNIIIRPSER